MYNTSGNDQPTLLNVYFGEKVKMDKQEKQEVVEVFDEILDDILIEVNRKDWRFAGPEEVKRLGSYYERLKVNRADEFDIMVPVTSLTNKVTTSRADRFYGFHRAVPDPRKTIQSDLRVVRKDVALPPLKAGQLFLTVTDDHLRSQHRDLMYGFDVIPYLVIRQFKRIVTDAIRDLGLRDTVRVSKKDHGPAITLRINHKDLPFEVSVDLVPGIEARVPFKAWPSWPRSGVQWPSPSKIHTIRSAGISVVAKKDLKWTLSFAESEKKLMFKMDANEGQRRKCLRIMKSLRDELWCPPGMKQELNSYHLKNILFWECERYPFDWQWTQTRLAERVWGMIYRLLDHLREGTLPAYFSPNANLIKETDSEHFNAIIKNVRRTNEILMETFQTRWDD